MDFYERIKELCKKEGVSVKSMLESLGIVYSSYYSSQQAKRLPGFPELYSISQHFNVSLDYLVSGKDKYDIPENLRLLIADLETLDEKKNLFSFLHYSIKSAYSSNLVNASLISSPSLHADSSPPCNTFYGIQKASCPYKSAIPPPYLCSIHAAPAQSRQVYRP